jgi:hypothetical protein
MREILSQNLNRGDAEMSRSLGKKRNKVFILFSLRLCVSTALFIFASCQSKPTDLRALAPAETLVYLEAKDLSKTLYALTENEAFRQAAKDKPNFSALENVQFAVAVTGFEATENKLTEENSVLNFKPHFVAIVDTHAWNWQTISLAENQINNFVKDVYGEEAGLEKSERNDGKWFVWTSKTGDKVFAFVRESQIFFGNDAAAIEKCMAVKNGESDSLLKNESLSRAYASNSENNLAFGYVSPEGVAQISNLAGVSVASETAEEAQGQSFIARVLPQILRNTTREIIWTAQKNGNKIEDKLSISLTPESGSVLKETLAQGGETQTNSAEFLPSNVFSTTRYNLKNPQVAWRSLLLVSAKNTDALSGNLIIQFSDKVLESYGISDAEMFLSAVDSEIFTAKFDAEGEKSVTIATVKDAEKIKKSLLEISFKSPAEKYLNAEIWYSEDKQTAAAFAENKFILGDTESVLKCLEAKLNEQNFPKNQVFQKFAGSKAAAITFAKDSDSAEKIVGILSESKGENKKFVTDYLTETRFSEKGIERKSLSDFGLIGSIIEQLKE